MLESSARIFISLLCNVVGSLVRILMIAVYHRQVTYKAMAMIQNWDNVVLTCDGGQSILRAFSESNLYPLDLGRSKPES
jgi:hypothetical protein